MVLTAITQSELFQKETFPRWDLSLKTATLRYSRWDLISQDRKNLDSIIQRKDLYQCAIIDLPVITSSLGAVSIKLQQDDLIE